MAHFQRHSDPSFGAWMLQGRIRGLGDGAHFYNMKRENISETQTASLFISICKDVSFHLFRKSILLGQPQLSLDIKLLERSSSPPGSIKCTEQGITGLLCRLYKKQNNLFKGRKSFH